MSSHPFPAVSDACMIAVRVFVNDHNSNLLLRRALEEKEVYTALQARAECAWPTTGSLCGAPSSAAPATPPPSSLLRISLSNVVLSLPSAASPPSLHSSRDGMHGVLTMWREGVLEAHWGAEWIQLHGEGQQGPARGRPVRAAAQGILMEEAIGDGDRWEGLFVFFFSHGLIGTWTVAFRI
jgi:hypothetical protein